MMSRKSFFGAFLLLLVSFTSLAQSQSMAEIAFSGMLSPEYKTRTSNIAFTVSDTSIVNIDYEVTDDGAQTKYQRIELWSAFEKKDGKVWDRLWIAVYRDKIFYYDPRLPSNPELRMRAFEGKNAYVQRAVWDIADVLRAQDLRGEEISAGFEELLYLLLEDHAFGEFYVGLNNDGAVEIAPKASINTRIFIEADLELPEHKQIVRGIKLYVHVPDGKNFLLTEIELTSNDTLKVLRQCQPSSVANPELKELLRNLAPIVYASISAGFTPEGLIRMMHDEILSTGDPSMRCVPFDRRW